MADQDASQVIRMNRKCFAHALIAVTPHISSMPIGTSAAFQPSRANASIPPGSDKVKYTSKFLWEIYTASEEDCIEYCRCRAVLEGLGLDKRDIEIMAQNCDKCILRGRCSVRRKNMFVGAKTC
jgi:hypothetical protein